MRLHISQVCLLALGIVMAFPPAAGAVVISTSKGAGADAEVRDHQPTTNFGASAELATRILDNFPFGNASDGSDRFSAMYLKFDIAGQAALPSQTTFVRLTYRNTNFTANRLSDTTPPGGNTDFRTGIAFYGLDRDDPGNSWSESTITYVNAPGLALGGDFNNGTKDFDFVDPDGAGPLRPPLTPLGVALFPEVPPQNHLPVGGQLVFSSTALNTFVMQSLNAGKTTVTIVASIAHDGKIPVNDWKNFNYVFNPKEQLKLSFDTDYDADTIDPNNPLGSPWSDANNSANSAGFSPFSPQLIIASTGDFDFNGVFNAADYVIWRNSNGTAAQYDAWRSSFGNTSGSGGAVGSSAASAAVPEAACELLLAMTAIIATVQRRGFHLLRART